MTDLSSDTIQQLRNIFHEEVDAAVSPLATSIQGGRDSIQNDVSRLRTDVRELKKLVSTHDVTLRQILANYETIKYTLGSHGLTLGGLRSDINSLKNSMRAQTKEMRNIAVLYEDFEAVVEAR